MLTLVCKGLDDIGQCCRALLQQEQARHEALEERFLEQNKRASTVNTELIRANTNLRQQLRAVKAQVSCYQHSPSTRANHIIVFWQLTSFTVVPGK